MGPREAFGLGSRNGCDFNSWKWEGCTRCGTTKTCPWREQPVSRHRDREPQAVFTAWKSGSTEVNGSAVKMGKVGQTDQEVP